MPRLLGPELAEVLVNTTRRGFFGKVLGTIVGMTTTVMISRRSPEPKNARHNLVLHESRPLFPSDGDVYYDHEWYTFRVYIDNKWCDLVTDRELCENRDAAFARF